MKNSKFLFLIGFLVINGVSFGQGSYAFRVLTSKGTSEVKSGSSWTAVKTGTSLQKTDELKVSENSYIGLVSETGRPIEIKQANTYKVADLLAKVSTNTSVFNKYTDFILSSAETKKNRLQATGAVSRGLEDITVFLPVNETSVFQNDVVINWEAKEAKPPFVVTLKNLFDDELLKAETSEYSYAVNLADPKLAGESAILVIVTSKSDNKNSSDQRSLKRLTGDEQKRIKTELGSEAQEESAIGYYMLAGYYEKNRLLIDAITSYEKAIKLEPSYKELYDDFLYRNNFKSAVKK